MATPSPLLLLLVLFLVLFLVLLIVLVLVLLIVLVLVLPPRSAQASLPAVPKNLPARSASFSSLIL